ncbi:MnuA family membrane nuclease [Mycoplasmopsis iners]|uniref:MnuA family membrane nuclease n=1 Tax=Mycoplasmopsis iners TaxID=76630 RepID=UPI000497AC04|nr:hypothetical protein [Mycoplasmopsis iners]
MKSKKNTKVKNIISGLAALIGASVIGAGSYFGYKNFQNRNTNKNSDSVQARELVKLENIANDQVLRFAHWNILNFGGSDSTINSVKVQAIAQLIYKYNIDAIGLTEVNEDDGPKVERIVKTLNSFMNNQPIYKFAYNNFNKAQYTISDMSVYKTQAEANAIIYRSDKLDLISHQSITPRKLETYNDFNYYFVRPFGYYKLLDKENSKSINFVIGHLDSPGQSSNVLRQPRDFLTNQIHNISLSKQQGYQELVENYYVADELAKLNIENEVVLFGGDTNLATTNSKLWTNRAKAFGYDQYYEDSIAKNYKTSIWHNDKTGETYYANAYDKWLWKEDDFYNLLSYDENNQLQRNFDMKIDTINGFNNGIWDRVEMQKLYAAIHKNSSYITDGEMVFKEISDHAPIIIDFIKKESSN